MLPRPGTQLERTQSLLRQFTATVYEKYDPVAYADWVSQVETTLRECFIDVPFERLYTERFWRLSTGPVARHHDMLRAEQRDQHDWLESVRANVEAMAKRFAEPPSSVAVVDTHVLMHAKPLEEIDWCNRLDAPRVRLVVPLRVVDEMDEHKYARRGELRDRARNRLRLLGRYVDQAPGEIRAGARVEIVSWHDLDPSGMPRPPLPPDVDILDTCEALRVYAAGNAVSIVTADVGMKLRAGPRSLPVLLLDESDMVDGGIVREPG
jgi:PIN domain-containing protein